MPSTQLPYAHPGLPVGPEPPQMLPTSLPSSIPWTSNNNALQWNLLTEIESPENFRVLFGKKTGSTGENKVDAHRRIAQALFTQYLHLPQATKVLSHRVGVQITSLVKKYKEQSKKLRVTGGGLRDEEDQDDLAGGIQNRYLKFYITGEGPGEDADINAKNLWAQIEDEFPFFPRLHRLLASKPNVEPYAITTGVGPNGPHTTYYQPPPPGHRLLSPGASQPPQTWQDHYAPVSRSGPIDPALIAPPSQRTFGMPIANADLPVLSQAVASPAGARRAPKTSAVARESIEHAKKTITPVAVKMSPIDKLVEIQRESMQALRERDERMSRTEMRLKSEAAFNVSRQQMFEEYKAGLLTVYT
ncbi:hypothetical protein HDZ31DRAFT_73939 [Schizophyllum fasciatum]